MTRQRNPEANGAGPIALRGLLWKSLAVELGLSGLLVPEELGGAGGSARDAAVVLAELGRVVAPVPFLTSAVVAAQHDARLSSRPLATSDRSAPSTAADCTS